jgi:hypothetical protein
VATRGGQAGGLDAADAGAEHEHPPRLRLPPAMPAAACGSASASSSNSVPSMGLATHETSRSRVSRSKQTLQEMQPRIGVLTSPKALRGQ